MELKMHNIHVETDLSELSAIFENGKILSHEIGCHIEFESILMEKEFLCEEIQINGFFDNNDDSTEINSIINSISEMNFACISQLSLNQRDLEETGTNEILEILTKDKKPRVVQVRGLSRSTPDFYNAKKISLKGKVLQNEISIRDVPRHIPERVSNPFIKNFDNNNYRKITGDSCQTSSKNRKDNVVIIGSIIV